MNIKSIQLMKQATFSPLQIAKPKKNDDAEKSRRIQRIIAKLKAGKKLTADEKAFLQKNDPALYQTAKKVEMQIEQVEEQLKQAKSKEEANDIIGNALGGVGQKDPDKEYIIAAIMNGEKEFKSSSDYKSLPATREEAKNDKTNGKSSYHHKDKNRDDDDDYNKRTGLYNANGTFNA